MRSVFAGVSLAIGAVACSSASDGVTSSSSSAVMATSAASPSSSSVPTTSVVPSSSAPPPTTSPPTLDAQIDAALQAYFDAYWECGTHPASCDPTTFTASEGTARANLVKFFSGMAGAGAYFGQDRRGSYERVEKAEVLGAYARVMVCLYDAGVVLGPNDPNGRPTVIDDSIGTKRAVYELTKTTGQWRVSSETQVVQVGSTACSA